MRKIFIALGIICLLIQGVEAHAEEFQDYTGAYLIQHCNNEKDSFVRGFCLGYIRSVVDLVLDSEVYLQDTPRFCVGEAPLKEWKAVVIQWLKKHPRDFHTSSRKVIVTALTERFPCRD